jgi:hypothetical protein
MITPDQVEDWIREVQERPPSAAAILRAIAARLAELDSWNNELLADNIELRSGNRVEDYESRIAALEYQLELIKRQAVGSLPGAAPAPETLSLLLFQPRGQVLRLPLGADALAHGLELARLLEPLDASQPPPGLLAAGADEELLFVFDSGRTVTLRAGEIAAAEPTLDWRQARRVDPRPGEELAAVLPINRLALYDACVQVSRRGCAKLMLKTSFQSFIARSSIGAGVKRRPDKTAALVFCARDGRLVLASREGFLLSLPAERLPYTVDEILQLGVSDYIVAAFSPAAQAHLLVLTNTGKAVHREIDWLEPAGSFKSRGQPAFSASRREDGVRVVGAAAVDETDWGVVLRANGALCAVLVAELLASGAVSGGEEGGELLAFTLLGAVR